MINTNSPYPLHNVYSTKLLQRPAIYNQIHLKSGVDIAECDDTAITTLSETRQRVLWTYDGEGDSDRPNVTRMDSAAVHCIISWHKLCGWYHHSTQTLRVICLVLVTPVSPSPLFNLFFWTNKTTRTIYWLGEVAWKWHKVKPSQTCASIKISFVIYWFLFHSLSITASKF